MKRSLTDCGYASSKVDEVLKEVGEVPESLVKLYFEGIKEMVQERLRDDPDYEKGSGRFPHLDKL